MSTTLSVSATAKKRANNPSWMVWLRQLKAIQRLELKKNFLGKRMVIMYLAALMPVFLLAAMASFPPVAKNLRDNNEMLEIYAFIFEGLILRGVVFYGCVWIFMNLFRGEMLDRSLHYYFLAPVRREVLVVGKYLSGLIISITLFSSSVLLSHFFLYLPRGYQGAVDFIFNGPGLKNGLTYLGITVLACVGYGAVFLLFGLFFRNPVIIAGVVYVWEMINFLLPPLLKKISIIYYLQSISPVPMSEGPFALIADPVSGWVAVLGIVGLTIVTLIIASYRIRRMEIKYTSE